MNQAHLSGKNPLQKPTMNPYKSLAVILSVMFMASMAQAVKHSDAFLEEGTMHVLRKNKTLTYSVKTDKAPILIEENDIIRMGEDSRVRLETVNKAEILLGSNAVMQARKWGDKEKAGNVRMLFGRFRTKVTGLASGDSYSVKTPTATIGVKGTEYLSAVATNGNTTLTPLDHAVELDGSTGAAQKVEPGQVSVVVSTSQATKPVAVPEEVKKEIANLDAPPVQSVEALALPAENTLVAKGIVSQKAVAESKVEVFTIKAVLPSYQEKDDNLLDVEKQIKSKARKVKIL